MTPLVVVSIHDVAPSTYEQSARWLDQVEELGMVATLLVVPGPWRGTSLATDPTICGWLDGAARRGHEIALHGWEHLATGPMTIAPRHWYGRVLGRGCAEFWELGEAAASRRLRAGLDHLHRLGFAPRGFTPPAWLASPGALRAIRAAGFAYTTTQWTILDLERGRRFRSFALSQRPGSALARPAATATRALAARRVRARRLLRVALHPADLEHETAADAAMHILRSARARGYTSTTYLGALTHLRERCP